MSSIKISPLQFTTELKKIYNGEPLKDFDFQNNWSEIQKVFDMAKLMIAPKPHIHGKKCSNCRHSMHCKSIKCPNCFTEQRKRKRQVPKVPQPAPVEVAEVILITTKYREKRSGWGMKRANDRARDECSICHNESNKVQTYGAGGFSMEPFDSEAPRDPTKPRHCYHKYCYACIIPQLEDNIMQCHHCTIGAIKNGKELLDRQIKRNSETDIVLINMARQDKEREERNKKKLEDVNVA